MQLRSIEIQNFKGLKQASFEPSSFACLVGENNAGKSSVLQAIVHALKRTASLPEELYYDRDSPIVFTVAFGGITEAHLLRLAEEDRAKLEDVVRDGELTLFLKYSRGARCEITTQRRVPKDPRYQEVSINAALTGKRGAAVRGALSEAYPELITECLPESISVTQAKDFLRKAIGRLPAEASERAEAPRPSGIASSISELLPEPIYIPAVKNLGDELKTSQQTSFGRLLGLLLEEMTPALSAISDSLAELDALLNRGGGRGRSLG